MKNHIGYLESTALKPAPCGFAGQKKKNPTKNPRTHTFFVVFSPCLIPSPINATGAKAINLPEMFEPEASL
ncbi:hypothetical protein [Pseudomonas beijingensis]|uniref:hypothetical protein n=1 Tax=Pseudomonas beijingensis TaxID=2954101 RepID=UPI0027353683|nr:hypothetical protein [Pseudomonas sp. FP2262]WLH43961.1 hypothetical protein PSH83_16355 [Pseudomonas sp. FP2262]